MLQSAIILFFLFAFNLTASTQSIFEQIDMKDGLPSNCVNACTEDKDGYFWAATDAGLCRYNGRIWQVWNTQNGLEGTNIKNLLADPSKGIWFEVNHQIWHLTADQFRLTQLPNPKNERLALLKVQDNGILYTNGTNVFSAVFNNQKINTANTNHTYITDSKYIYPTQYQQRLEQLSKEPFRFASTHFIGNHNSLFFIDNNEVKKINETPLFKEKTKTFIAETEELIYIAAQNQGIVVIDTFANQALYDQKMGLGAFTVNNIYIDKNKNVFFPTSEGGIYVIHNNERVFYKIAKGPIRDIKYNKDYFIAIDNGTIYIPKTGWLTDKGESNYLDKIDLTFYPTCLEVNNNKILVGASNGVHTYSLSDKAISKVNFIPTTFSVKQILYTNEKYLLLSEQNQLFQLSNGKAQQLDIAFPSINFNKIEPISKGYALITDNDGVYFLDKNFKLIKQLDKSTGLPNNTVFSIFEKNNEIWLGQLNAVTKLVDNTPVRIYTQKDGLKGNKVLSLGQNDHEIFLIITEQNTLQLLNDKIVSLSKNNLIRKHNDQLTAAAIADNTDVVMLGNYYGLQSITMIDYQPFVDATKPTIKSIAINGTWQVNNKNISLPHNFSEFVISINPGGNLLFNKSDIFYRLNGKDWLPVSDTLTINLRDLPSGNYKIDLRTINAYGIENIQNNIVTFTVKKPWWLQTWFLVLASLLALALVIAGARFYSKQKLAEQLQAIKVQQELDGERKRISRDLHDSMGAYTSALIANVQTAKSQLGAHDNFDQMQTNAQQILQSLRETIWVLNNKTITVHELNDRFKNHVVALLRNYDKLEFVVSESIVNDAELSPTKAVQLNNIMYEALQNTLKHSEATKIFYTIKSDNALTITLADNGKGFDMEQLKSVNGLDNMEWRARNAQIKFELIAKKNEGTKIVLHSNFK